MEAMYIINRITLNSDLSASGVKASELESVYGLGFQGLGIRDLGV